MTNPCDGLKGAVMALAALGGGADAQSRPWRVGEPLPALRLPTVDGARTVDLGELVGTKTLLIEFASW